MKKTGERYRLPAGSLGTNDNGCKIVTCRNIEDGNLWLNRIE